MKTSLGFRLLTTGALMLVVAIALATTELVSGRPLGSAFSGGVFGAAVVVLVAGWLLDRRFGDDE
jgi:hypothetical protein